MPQCHIVIKSRVDSVGDEQLQRDIGVEPRGNSEDEGHTWRVARDATGHEVIVIEGEDLDGDAEDTERSPDGRMAGGCAKRDGPPEPRYADGLEEGLPGTSGSSGCGPTVPLGSLGSMGQERAGEESGRSVGKLPSGEEAERRVCDRATQTSPRTESKRTCLRCTEELVQELCTECAQDCAVVLCGCCSTTFGAVACRICGKRLRRTQGKPTVRQ